MLYWQKVNKLRSKVERAENHIRDLQRFWTTFEQKAYPVARKKDLKTRQYIYTLRYVKPIPDVVPWMVGDAVHNLRSALDHLAYYLVSIATSGKGPFEEVYFPVARSREGFKSRLRSTKKYKSTAGGTVKRLRKCAIDAIKRIEPYEGGRGEILFHIHKLDIIDKHHVLLAVGSMNPSHSMPPSDVARYRKGLGIARNSPDFTPKKLSTTFLTESVLRHFPLKAGDELKRVPFSEFDENMYFRFDVAFGEPEVLKGKAIIPTLFQAAKFIREIIRNFDERGVLKEIC
jgi:hypothetical protein